MCSDDIRWSFLKDNFEWLLNVLMNNNVQWMGSVTDYVCTTSLKFLYKDHIYV
jgi:hypothetical protein